MSSVAVVEEEELASQFPYGEVAGESSDIIPSLDLATSADYLAAVNDGLRRGLFAAVDDGG
uniref:Uncharacterized protein n=1 Tax=Oryza meridionalis TaxID=40149 RepID=A0A0E0DKS2_9ORYZ